MRTYDAIDPVFPDRATWTLPQVLHARAASHGTDPYLVVPSTGESYTFAQTAQISANVGANLLHAGGVPEDRVLILGPNASAYIFAWYGASMAGMIEAPINTAYRGRFLAHQIDVAQPRFAVVHADHVAPFLELPEETARIARFFVYGQDDGRIDSAIASVRELGVDAERFDTLLQDRSADLPEVEPHHIGAILFTSGTTGPSKGVIMPHAQFHFVSQECVSLTRLTEADTYLSVGPLFHGNAQFLAAYPALIAGAKFVLHEKFSASQWLDWIRDSGATVTNFVGVMMDFVWKQEPTDHDSDNDLRCIFAVPTAHSVLDQFKKRFGVEAFVACFGQTEISLPILTPYGEVYPVGAAGLEVTEWFDVRLVDPETDEEVAIGELGELVLRPKLPWTISQGYFGMPEKTAETFRNLWFHTGDGLRRDDEGWYYFVDRLKDTIRRRGENISSYELEQAVLTHPGVSECAVVAVPSDVEAGEDEVMLFIVAAGDATPSAAELWDHCDANMPYFAIPRYIRFIDELPRTPSEKLKKTDLRDIGVDDETFDRNAGNG